LQLSTDATSAKVTVCNLRPVVANPIVDPAPIGYGAASKFQFPVDTFADPNNDPLSYTALGIPPGTAFDGPTRTFSGTPTQADIFPVAVAGSAGVWWFYVQHQFEGVCWARHGEWDYTTVALQGSSFYKLPKVLQWFSGSIGFHHIHHLKPGIPNYHLEKCHQAVPLFETAKPVTLLLSLNSLTFRLWDEQRQRLVGYGPLAHCPHATAAEWPDLTGPPPGNQGNDRTDGVNTP
jgi:hypothetical protein